MHLEYMSRYEDHPELEGKIPYPHVLLCKLTLDGNDVFHRVGREYLPNNDFVEWMMGQGWWSPEQVDVLKGYGSNILVLSFATAADAMLARLRWSNT